MCVALKFFEPISIKSPLAPVKRSLFFKALSLISSELILAIYAGQKIQSDPRHKMYELCYNSHTPI